MGQRGLFVLLLSGSVLLRCSLNKQFHFVNLKKTWTDAQSYCKEKFTNLAPLDDPNDAAKAQEAVQGKTVWIGLSEGSWMWSQDISADILFTKWATDEPGSDNCVVISGQGLWSTRKCSSKQHSFCGNDKELIMVETLMNWTEAQSFCRMENTDLTTISNQETNDNVSSQLQDYAADSTAAKADDDSDSDESKDSSETPSSNKGKNIHAWIGLYRESWMWSDRSNGSYTMWADQQPVDPEDDKLCGLMKTSNGVAYWYARPCTETHPFVCYAPRVLRSLKVWLTGEPADLNNPQLQDSILQQLQQRLKQRGVQDVKLRWGTQADGKAFHREEEGAPPGVCEEEGTVCQSLV